MIEGFFLGVIVTASLIAGSFFLKFWKQTRDQLFLFFAIAFYVEGFNRSAFLFLDRPNEGDPLIYFIRFLSYALIVVAIVNKNRR